MLRDAPAQLARRLGLPVVHASYAGDFQGMTPGNEVKPYASRCLGETQITDGHGQLLARMAYEDGEGFVTAEIMSGQVAGDLAPIPDDFWAVSLSPGASKVSFLSGCFQKDSTTLAWPKRSLIQRRLISDYGSPASCVLSFICSASHSS